MTFGDGRRWCGDVVSVEAAVVCDNRENSGPGDQK